MPRRRTSRRPRRRTSRSLRENASVPAEQFEQIRGKLSEIGELLSAAEDGDEQQRTEIADRTLSEEVPYWSEKYVDEFVEKASRPDANLKDALWGAVYLLGNAWQLFGEYGKYASDGARRTASNAIMRAQTRLLNAYDDLRRQRGFA